LLEARGKVFFGILGWLGYVFFLSSYHFFLCYKKLKRQVGREVEVEVERKVDMRFRGEISQR